MTQTGTDVNKQYLALLKKQRAQRLINCVDPYDLDSRPHAKQQEVLEDINSKLIRWVVAANQVGKSLTGAREAAWLFSDTHPFFTRPAEWGNSPLLMIIVGRQLEQVQTELWERKIKPFLTPGSFKETRVGSVIQTVTNLQNGNKIIFASHHHADEAREKLQAYVAHWVWIDEMPSSTALVSELLLRTIANRGRFLGTFTPLIRNHEIKEMIDNADALPHGKKYNFKMMDNPKFKGREEEVTQSIKATCQSDAEFRARMYGEWMVGFNNVYSYSRDRHCVQLPDNYDAMWRHVVAVDPAASGLAGLTVWAESPHTNIWYNIKAKYIKGDAAFLLVTQVEQEIAGLNIVRRICDSNPSGFYKEAARRRISYVTMSEKAGRKTTLIEGVNTALAKEKVFLSREGSEALDRELAECAWSETNPDKMVNKSSYHLADTMQYFIDNMPKPESKPVLFTYDQQIQHAHRQRKAKEIEEKKKRAYKILGRRAAWSKRWA